jgi:hypothetical protein
VELGYDYCLKDECQQRCLKRVLLAAVAVNKAADYYSRAEDVVPPRLPPTTTASIDAEEFPQRQARKSRSAGGRRKRPPTGLERLRAQEVELDEALRRCYERFCQGEITAREMDRERDQLVGSFNQQVMSENIRYRSMLRKRSYGSR